MEIDDSFIQCLCLIFNGRKSCVPKLFLENETMFEQFLVETVLEDNILYQTAHNQILDFLM